MKIMQFLELHARITEFMKILLCNVRITKNHENLRIPKIIYKIMKVLEFRQEKHEYHEHHRIPNENHENN